MTDLSPEARELLELARDEDSPSGADRTRVRRALASSLAAGAVSSTAASAAAASKGAGALGAVAGASGAVAKSAAGLWLTLGIVAGLAGSAAVYVSTTAKAPIPQTARVTAPGAAIAVPPAAATQVVESVPSPPAPVEETAALPAVAVKRVPKVERAAAVANVPAPEPTAEVPGPATPPPPAAAPASSLGAETSLLEAARSALSKGNAPLALTLLDRHEAQFPGGALLEERLAAKVFALCDLGRKADAARTAARLLRVSPSTPLRARVLDSCAYEH